MRYLGTFIFLNIINKFNEIAALSNPEDVTTLVSNYDFVVNAVPGFMGFKTAKAIIKAGIRHIKPGSILVFHDSVKAFHAVP